MKGWIKVHRYDDKKEYWIQTSNITHVTEDDRGHALICTASDTPKILVMESLNEVLALIEKAEGKKGLYEKLKEVQEECKRQLLADMSKQCGCETCSYFDTDESWLCDLLRREKVPCDWDLDMIPEEYR